MSKKKNIPAKASVAGNAGDVPPRNEISASDRQVPSNNAFEEKVKGKEVYLLLGAIVLGCLFIFKGFLTFEKIYLFKDIGSDSINMYVPWITQLSDYIKANGVPTWTFSQGMGQNIFPLWLGDFFSNFLMLLSKDNIPYAFAYMEVLKIILCGFVFYKYLSELKVKPFVACIGAFLFAFSGYIILGSCWIIFSVEALYIATILYGFERWLNRGKWLWLVVGLTCMSLLQPFLLFPYSVFLVLYAPVRYNDVHDGNWKKFPMFVIKTIGLSVIGVAISGYQLLPDLLQYIESPRVGGEARLIDKLKAQPVFGIADDWLRFTTTFRAFGSDMLGTGSAFQGWQNYLEAPLFYCGILCLVTFPQVFTGLNKKQKITYGIFAGLFALPILFPFFRYSFWAYSGDYFRAFSNVITMILIVFTVKALNSIITTGKLNLIVLGGTVVFLLFLLYSPAEQFAPAINSGLRSTVTLLIFLYTGILFGLTRGGDMGRYSKIALVVLCFGEAVLFSSSTVNDRDTLTSSDLKDRIGYNDYTVDAIKYIKAQDKGFYRVNKDYFSGLAIHASINDAKAQGYYGTPSYHSFNQKNYIRFLGEVNVLDPKDENATRWARGLADRPLLFSMASGKYALTKQSGQQLRNFGYDSLAMFGNVKVFRNKFSLPLGYAYNTVLDDVMFKRLSPFQKDVYLLRGCVVEDKDLVEIAKEFNIEDTAAPFSGDVYGQYASALRKDSVTITDFKESHIKGTINLQSPEILFFSIPLDEGWKATINGADAKIYRVNGGFIGLNMPAGKSDIDLHFVPRLMKTGGMVSLVALLAFGGLLAYSITQKKKEQPADV
jgi:uncharacterized membrane protein YfhO